MRLSDQIWQTAEKFVRYIYKETGLPTIVCNEQGIITKAHDTKRIGGIHEGSVKILNGEVAEYAVTAEEAANNSLLREGYNCPVVIEGTRVGTIGIAGKLEIAKPVAKIASIALASWIREANQQDILRETSEMVFADIKAFDERVKDISEKLRIMAEEMALASKRATEKTNATGQIVATVQDIAQQTQILSINGSIEAARAGEYGRAFAVVVDEMGRLAQSTSEATSKIQETVSEILNAIEAVHSSIDKSSSLFQDNLKIIQEITPMMESLRASIRELELTFKIG
jgi:hypothetical protein